MKVLLILGFLMLSIFFVSSYELCGPRSCMNGYFCASDYSASICRPEAQAYTIIQVNITNEGAWPDSAQFKGTIRNICGVRIRKIVLSVSNKDFPILKTSAIWNARYSKEFEEISLPDYADGIPPNDELYQFGFILKNSNTPKIKIKSIRF
ncbi:hypothetical protein DICPUDRAFT_40441 [Dictyostelium purpureum]|uniref:Carbohydrate binding domain-containing protein n=1 Tax=Dictyostelium purpureum TaxID=5786 RepID=F0ZY73_DICPU|nr:uncharacterized protein DICPUDRAFT_40441 [Dictyostelium purpureum]EGC31118.1 hypothetical protein DICPUDRAFT_40441 [Dictyostelium purpureum]|eukprot:XP_003292367.1 hypothetical protein DICPUDRAFT_40441 [Dictyostelium purpureum]